MKIKAILFPLLLISSCSSHSRPHIAKDLSTKNMPYTLLTEELKSKDQNQSINSFVKLSSLVDWFTDEIYSQDIQYSESFKITTLQILKDALASEEFSNIHPSLLSLLQKWQGTIQNANANNESTVETLQLEFHQDLSDWNMKVASTKTTSVNLALEKSSMILKAGQILSSKVKDPALLEELVFKGIKKQLNPIVFAILQNHPSQKDLIDIDVLLMNQKAKNLFEAEFRLNRISHSFKKNQEIL